MDTIGYGVYRHLRGELNRLGKPRWVRVSPRIADYEEALERARAYREDAPGEAFRVQRVPVIWHMRI